MATGSDAISGLTMGASPREFAPRKLGTGRRDAAAGNHSHLLEFQSSSTIDDPVGTLGSVTDSTTRTLMYDAYIPPESWRPGHMSRVTFTATMSILNAPARTVRVELGILTRAGVFQRMFDYTTPTLAVAASSRQVYLESLVYHILQPNVNYTRFATTKLEIGMPGTTGVWTDGLIALTARQFSQATTTDSTQTLRVQVYATLGDATTFSNFTGKAAMIEDL